MQGPRITGTIASIGYAAGPLCFIDEDSAAYASSGDVATEASRLHSAIAQAGSELATLMAASDEEGAAILEFQLAMLEDESLSVEAFAAIAKGTDAAAAWAAALDAEIANYDAAENAYFRARGADLRDIRDRVRHGLGGTDMAVAPAGAVLYGRDLTPTRFLSVDWARGGGIILSQGSAASHVAMLARSRAVPMLVSVTAPSLAEGALVLLDAEHGTVTMYPEAAEQHDFDTAAAAYRRLVGEARGRVNEPAITADGQAVEVLVNIAEPTEVDTIDIAACDGVGLMRTEFLFTNGLPDEERQYEAYSRVLRWAGNKPVTIRTVDAGGDKPVANFTVAETNPFLGLRGIRLCLQRPDVFRVQIRALLRAAVHGDLKVMFPMVSIIAEYEMARDMFAEELSLLARRDVSCRMPPLGIMVEVPAVAIAPEPFVEVAFLSIGSNDLTQYVMAAGRDNGAVAGLADVQNPAVLSLLRRVTDFGRAKGIPVSLCGDAAGDPRVIAALLGTGLARLSMAPSQLPLAKAAIARSTARLAQNGQT